MVGNRYVVTNCDNYRYISLLVLPRDFRVIEARFGANLGKNLLFSYLAGYVEDRFHGGSPTLERFWDTSNTGIFKTIPSGKIAGIFGLLKAA